MGGNLATDTVDISIQGPILNDTIVGRKLVGRLLPIQTDFLAFRYHHQVPVTGYRTDGAQPVSKRPVNKVAAPIPMNCRI
jgi:hypothetical protein